MMRSGKALRTAQGERQVQKYKMMRSGKALRTAQGERQVQKYKMMRSGKALRTAQGERQVQKYKMMRSGKALRTAQGERQVQKYKMMSHNEEPVVRRRAVGETATQPDERANRGQGKKEEEADDSPLGAWKPLLANMCVCSALALGVYVCYRSCFH
ncbi:UNVERIFIED_CONTAM: hypothetical protein FKN15_018918 [Acipenser sinensis]